MVGPIVGAWLQFADVWAGKGEPTARAYALRASVATLSLIVGSCLYIATADRFNFLVAVWGVSAGYMPNIFTASPVYAVLLAALYGAAGGWSSRLFFRIADAHRMYAQRDAAMRGNPGEPVGPGPDYTPPESPEEVLRRYSAGERYFGDMELEGLLDFRGVCLAGAVFDGSGMLEGDFRDADLRGSSFRHTYIKLADFRGADLRRSTFAGALVEAAKFEGAHYEGTEFFGAYCNGNTIGLGDDFP